MNGTLAGWKTIVTYSRINVLNILAIEHRIRKLGSLADSAHVGQIDLAA